MTESQEKQTILFLPGLLCDQRLFAAQIDDLKENYNILAIPVDFANHISELASGVIERVEAALAATGNTSGGFALCGLSMGGYVALEVMRQLQAKAQLHRVERLILLNTSARADSDEQRQKREALIGLAQIGRFKGVTPRLLPQLINENHLKDERITGTILAMAEDTGREGFVRQQRAILSRQDSRDLLPSLTMPALLIGAVDDKLTPPAMQWEMAQAMSNSEIHVLDDCGHLSPLEQGKRVTDILINFMAS